MEPEQGGAAPSTIYTYQWRQTITFQECAHDTSRPALPNTQQLSVDSVFVLYNQEESILRYALSNSIGPVKGRNGSSDWASRVCPHIYLRSFARYFSRFTLSEKTKIC